MENKKNIIFSFQTFFKTLLFGTLVLFFSSCGPQAFQVGTLDQEKTPGWHYFPPKVDFLLVEDNTGSMMEAYQKVLTQVPDFLKSLGKKSWDYRLASIPLVHMTKNSNNTNVITTDPFPISEVLTSRYDSNWNQYNKWKAPFPGADPLDPALFIASSLFQLPEKFSSFLTDQDLTTDSIGNEPGLETIYQTLITAKDASPSYLRDDALLVILLLSTGNDTSLADLRYFTLDGHLYYPVWDYSDSSSKISSFKDNFLSLKLDQSAMIKFFSITAHERTHENDLCKGAVTRPGTRYDQLAQAINQNPKGKFIYDICHDPLETVLSGVKSYLHQERASFYTRFLVLGQEPNVDTVEVIKWINGDPKHKVKISPYDPKQPSAGYWSYEGGPKTVHTIEYRLVQPPALLNKQTGYVIELHGTAELKGDDKVKIYYKPKGVNAAG